MDIIKLESRSKARGQKLIGCGVSRIKLSKISEWKFVKSRSTLVSNTLPDDKITNWSSSTFGYQFVPNLSDQRTLHPPGSPEREKKHRPIEGADAWYFSETNFLILFLLRQILLSFAIPRFFLFYTRSIKYYSLIDFAWLVHSLIRFLSFFDILQT